MLFFRIYNALNLIQPMWERLKGTLTILNTVIVNGIMDFILKVLSGSAMLLRFGWGAGEDRSLSAFLSVSSWKSRSARLLLEIYPVPQFPSFDFIKKRKRHIFSWE